MLQSGQKCKVIQVYETSQLSSGSSTILQHKIENTIFDLIYGFERRKFVPVMTHGRTKYM